MGKTLLLGGVLIMELTLLGGGLTGGPGLTAALKSSHLDNSTISNPYNDDISYNVFV